MIVPDVNLLVYAHDPASPFHDKAQAWLSDLMNGAESIGLPWVVLSGFVRVSTNPRASARPLTADRAFEQVDRMLEPPHVRVIGETADHATVMRRLLVGSGLGSRFTTDGHVAALAVCHHATVHSSDADFGRFAGVRWHDPLAAV